MIAVTGANGLLGSYVVRTLLRHKEPFLAIKRKDSDISLLHDVNEDIKWYDADLLDVVSLNEALKNVTHVIHTAAVVSYNPRRARQVMEINVEGTRNIVNACLANGVKRIVHVSSVAALAAQKGQTTITEENKWIESQYQTVYAKSKYLSELEIFRGQEEGISSVIVSPSLILADTDWNNSSAQVFKYIWNQTPFYSDGSVNYVDVDDVAQIIYALLRAPIEGERFIVSAGKMTYKELFGLIAKGLGKKIPSIRVSKNFLKIGAYFETLRSIISGSEPRLTKETARIAGADYLFENRKIVDRLNFKFQPIDKTLQRCCRYYIEKMNAKK
ncbi:MAG TPA: NAD-dependent epimerase/dehydratase family protein [Chryseolinea sp.]|nr:NAD-dependent epimerase/dehydratase family protein [Chryseolinea sp.]